MRERMWYEGVDEEDYLLIIGIGFWCRCYARRFAADLLPEDRRGQREEELDVVEHRSMVE